MTKRYQHTDPRGRFAPRILWNAASNAWRLGLVRQNSTAREKNARFVLTESGRLVMAMELKRLIKTHLPPKHFKTTDLVNTSIFFGNAISGRKLVEQIKQDADAHRAEIRIDDAEKRGQFCDFLENVITHIKTETGREYTGGEIESAVINILFERAVGTAEHLTPELAGLETEDSPERPEYPSADFDLSNEGQVMRQDYRRMYETERHLRMDADLKLLQVKAHLMQALQILGSPS